MQNYRRRLEEHLLPTFEECQLTEISRDTVATWEKKERAAGYADASIRSWRALLHLILADAVEDGLILVNPAAKRKGRGKRVGRSQHRAAEQTITTALGVLLIAERAALLSGRDDEFVAIVTAGFTGCAGANRSAWKPSTCGPDRSGWSGRSTRWTTQNSPRGFSQRETGSVPEERNPL
jgi:hypothetical protein